MAQEPALDFRGITLSPQKETVRRFYKELWDHADKTLIPEIPRGLYVSRVVRPGSRCS